MNSRISLLYKITIKELVSIFSALGRYLQSEYNIFYVSFLSNFQYLRAPGFTKLESINLSTIVERNESIL